MALKALCPTPPPWLALPGCSCLEAFALAVAAPEDSSLSSPQLSLVLLMFQVSAQMPLMGRLPQLPFRSVPVTAFHIALYCLSTPSALVLPVSLCMALLSH